MENTKKNPTKFIIEMNGKPFIMEEIDLPHLVVTKNNEVHLVLQMDKKTVFRDEKTNKTISIYLK